ncbi:MAG: hypothetical protein Q8927_14915 [Bacteroidota bacterium]|nr:hypothetical protein [Bacteroidota bacterium]MDP4256008.1 hypothetical protein [Bacteroidota bacterium]MDP4258057.1 hypothetical protein [Bacteroidota bacterium]
MKRLMIRMTSFAVVFFVSAAVRAQGPGSELVGKWVRNDAASNAGEHISINSIPLNVEVARQNESLLLTYTFRNGKGEVSAVTDTLKQNGQASQKTTKSGLQKTSSVQGNADRKGFTISTEYKNDQGNVVRTSKEMWTKNGNGQLQVVLDMTYNGNDLHFIEVFDHQ